MTNEIVVTFKAGPGYEEPWIVVHADSPANLDQMLDSLTGDQLARVHGLSEIFQNVQAAAPLAPPPASVEPQPAAPSPWTAPEVPQYQPPAQPAPTHQAPTQSQTAGTPALPDGVSVWTAPNSKKPNYTSVYFSYPYIGDPAARTALSDKLKGEGWAKPSDTNAKPWVWEASKSSFTVDRAKAIFAEFSGAFG